MVYLQKRQPPAIVPLEDHCEGSINSNKSTPNRITAELLSPAICLYLQEMTRSEVYVITHHTEMLITWREHMKHRASVSTHRSI